MLSRLRNSSKLGVTLIEILLVITAAAFIAVLAVRYYQRVTADQQAAQTLLLIQNITNAMNKLAQGTGLYKKEGEDSEAIAATRTSELRSMLGTLNTSWGTEALLTWVGPISYTTAIPNMPANVCETLKTNLAGNRHFNIVSDCGTPFTYHYYMYVGRG